MGLISRKLLLLNKYLLSNCQVSLTILGTRATDLNKTVMFLSQRTNSLVEVTEKQTGNYKHDVVRNR